MTTRSNPTVPRAEAAIGPVLLDPRIDHPYRPLFVERVAPRESGSRREVRIACAILIGVSAIQILSGAQAIAGALGLSGGVAGLVSNWRSSWKTPSSSC